MGRRILRSGLLVLLVAGLMPVALPAMAARADTGLAGGRLAGVDFITLGRKLAPFRGEFQRIRADGANTVSFDVWWVVPNNSSSKVAPVQGVTDTDADLLAATQEARQAGLRVMLTPKVVIGLQGGNTGWRGLYNPPDPAAFFSSYQSMTDHYAVLAQQAGMSTVVVGSEMIASDQYVSDWRRIISSARMRFSGAIGYEADWREISKFGFGDAVDVILLSAYFPLSNEERPTLAQLKAGWHGYSSPGQSETQDAFSAVSGLAHRWNKPITFGEGGYTATTYPADQPWWNRPNLNADLQVQYLGYQALLQTFAGQPWWGGVVWWAWNDDPNQRSPEGKPAESLIGAPCLAAPVTSPSGFVRATPGSGQAAGASNPCNRGPVDPSVGPASANRLAGGVPLASGIALGTLVLAITALILLGGWLRQTDRRTRRRATDLAMR
jgi:hypothetical protein